MFFKKKRKRKLVSTVPNTIENKIKNCEDIRKNKVQIEFNDLKSSSVKFLGVKNQTNIKCSSRFLSGKLLMFAKLSLKTFVYSLVELLHFPEENPIVADIYKKYKIYGIQCYQILTDTDSTSIQFIIASDPASTYPECDVRDILFEIFSKTEISKRFDKSNKFWKRFNIHKPEEQKVKKCPRIDVLNNILDQVPKIVNTDCVKFDRNTEYFYRKERDSSILDFILKQRWKKNTSMMDVSMEIS